MEKIYFVSGIDTGVGKSFATGAMARFLRERGVAVTTLKLVQTGNEGFSEDIALHRTIMGVEPTAEDRELITAPQIFKFPSSPHLAAELESRKFEPSAVDAALETLLKKYSPVLVEGAGGLAVPLSGEELTIDFAAARSWPLILVSSGRLGSLNHTILSIEAAAARNMRVAGVVYNYCDEADPVIDRDTPRMIIRALERHGYPPALVRLDKIVPGGKVTSDFSAIFGMDGTRESFRKKMVMSDYKLHRNLERDRKVLWHPYASATNPPPVFFASGAAGTRIRISEGKTLIDGVSSWWCMCHGHNHPHIVEMIRRQAESLTQVMFAGFTHEPAIRLAEQVNRRTPPGLKKLFFVDSGSVAVECALKLAIEYQQAAGFPARRRFATVRGGYHGDTFAAMSVSDPGGMHRMFSGMTAENFFAPRPECRFGDEWDPEDFAAMERLLDEHARETAAVIIEPIFQGANGMRFYHPQYLRELRRACTERGILLILDEVATGFGRLGRFFAAEYAEVVADIVCIGKGLTGGALPLAAVISSEAVAERVSDGDPGILMHGPTFMANPLACAAGCASLELFDEYDWRLRVREIESALRSGLGALRTEDNVADVRVLGAVGVLELRRMPTPERVHAAALESGVWLRPFGSWLYTMPPFITPPEEIGRIIDAMAALARVDK